MRRGAGGGRPHLHPGRRRGDDAQRTGAADCRARPACGRLAVQLPVWPFWLAGALCEAVCVPLGIEPPLYRRRVDFFTKSRAFDIAARPRGARVRPARRPAGGHPADARRGIGERVAVIEAEIPAQAAGPSLRRSARSGADQLFDAGRRRARYAASSSAGRGWGAPEVRADRPRARSHVPGALGLVLRKTALSAAARRLRAQRGVRPERRAAASAQDPHRRQRRHRRQLPARRQGRRQPRHPHRQRRVHRPQHDPVLQERRHRDRRRRQHRVQLRDLLGQPGRRSAPTRCLRPTAT